MLEHNEKMTFENLSLQTMQSMQIWKCFLICMSIKSFYVFFSILFTSYCFSLYISQLFIFFGLFFRISSCFSDGSAIICYVFNFLWVRYAAVCTISHFFVYVCIYIYIYIHTQIYKYIYIYIYIYNLVHVIYVKCQ